ncbi:hypothetical protein HDV04_005429 [Boothiomyces sp. JEL0838]|nr:hypothetical protein HDV04_005429 [Boothiomyces sp. JEL0838]
MMKKEYGYKPSKIEYGRHSKVAGTEKSKKNNLLSALELKLAESEATSFKFEGIAYNIHSIINKTIKTRYGNRVPKELRDILKTPQFEDFLKKGLAFIREKLVKVQDRCSKPYLEVPTAICQQIAELNKTEYQTTEKLSPEDAKAETASTFHSFSEAYASF